MANREQWLLRNKSNRTIIIGDLPKTSSIEPGTQIDLLSNHTPDEVSRSQNLAELIDAKTLSLVKKKNGKRMVTNTGTAIDTVQENELDNHYTKAEADELFAEAGSGGGGLPVVLDSTVTSRGGFTGYINHNLSDINGTAGSNYLIELGSEPYDIIEIPNGELLVTLIDEGQVVKINPVEKSIVSTLNLTGVSGREIRKMVYCPVNEYVYIATDGNGSSSNGTITVIDPEDDMSQVDQIIMPLPGGSGSELEAGFWNPHNGYIYWPLDKSANDTVVFVIDPSLNSGIGDHLSSVTVGASMNAYSGCACNLNGKSYIAGFTRNGVRSVVAIDGTSLDAVINIAASGAANTQDCVYNPIDQMIWASTANNGAVRAVRINPLTNTYVDALSGVGGSMMFRNPLNNMIYNVGEFNARILNPWNFATERSVGVSNSRFAAFSNLTGHFWIPRRISSGGIVGIS